LTSAAPADIGQSQGASKLARFMNLRVEYFTGQDVVVAPNIKILSYVTF
jgi:hypothetical protein